jgi:kinesin family protein 5
MQKSENIRVAIRFRPHNKKEEGKDTDFHLKLDSKQNLIEISDNGKEIQQFAFDHVFDSTTTQEKVFNSVAKDALDWVCQGYNATIFAYGATSSGKSFTMFGSEDGKTEKGIIPRACDTLFQNINNSEDVVEANMKCSFLEIYREHIRDLLDTTKSDTNDGGLRIRYNPNRGAYVQGLIEKYVYSSQDILSTIKEGTMQRTIASTSLNSVSSRSHAVLTLILTQKLSDGSEIVSKLHLIDLAGSENVGRSEVQGITLTEAQTINKSLSCLGNVIYALTEKGREHIPYRDSKLTYLLQDSLGGNAKTILIATASPSSLCYSETIGTLKFAKRAKEIKNIPKINKNESIPQLLQTIEVLQKRIAELEGKCEDSQVIIQAVEHAEQDTKEIVLVKTKCDRLEKKIVSMEDENKKGLERNKEVKELFRKQRELARKASKDLYKERIKNHVILNELEQLRLFYDSMQEAVSTPEVLPLIMNRIKIIPAPLTIEIPEPIDEIEIESP